LAREQREIPLLNFGFVAFVAGKVHNLVIKQAMAIPAASELGLDVLLLVGLIVGTQLFRRQQKTLA